MVQNTTRSSKMDELEFRRKVMSDPKQRDKELLEMIATNESSAKYVDDVLQLDKHIAQAFKIDVPDELADKILFQQSALLEDEKVIRPQFVRKAMAIAASIAFTAGLLVGQIQWGNILVSPAQASLSEMAVQHVIHEEGFVNRLDEQADMSQINAKMQPFAYKMDGDFPYHVYYLNHCGFGKENAVHMVFQGEKGKVTLFFTPIVSKQALAFKQDGMSGIVEPIGEASLILVGEQGENVSAIAQKLMPMIQSSI
ncbi:chemotaxis protein [Vibrio metoecus]|nr:chemotaxis protein [Vibrio metoecus]PAR61958.1 chemotaxis protein [Vibrio metoecus]